MFLPDFLTESEKNMSNQFNPPLTIDELHNMANKPYWHKSLSGAENDRWTILPDNIAEQPQDYHYGDRWLAYKHEIPTEKISCTFEKDTIYNDDKFETRGTNSVVLHAKDCCCQDTCCERCNNEDCHEGCSLFDEQKTCFGCEFVKIEDPEDEPINNCISFIANFIENQLELLSYSNDKERCQDIITNNIIQLCNYAEASGQITLCEAVACQNTFFDKLSHYLQQESEKQK